MNATNDSSRHTTKRLIIVADDFGITPGVSEGILKAYREGIVTEMSLQLNSLGTQRALELIKQYGIDDVGIHLLLYSWKATGRILHREDYIQLFREKSIDDIKRIVKEELIQFERLVGRKPTHIIPQFGIHGNLKVLESIVEYAKEYNIPMRIPRTVLTGDINDENYAAEIILKRHGVRTTKHLFGHFTGRNYDEIKASLRADLSTVAVGETAEIIFHPGFVDRDLLRISSLRYERGRDLALCLDEAFRQAIETMGLERIGYKQL